MKAKTYATLVVHSERSDHWRRRRKALIDGFTEGASAAGLVYSGRSNPPKYKRSANADLIAIGDDIRRVIRAYDEAQEADAREA